MDEQLDKLRSAGFSEADIAEYVEAQKGAPVVNKEVVVDQSEILVDETAPRRQDQQPQADDNTLGTISALGAKLGQSAIQTAVENPVTTIAGGYGGYKALQGVNALRKIAQAPKVTPTVTPSAPVAPQSSTILGPDGRPMTRPVAPTKAAAELAEKQAKARGAQIANIGRKFALDKLIPGMASKVLGPISAVGGMVVPSASESDYKYQFPITGPAKGSEINQQTGQPWTRAELDAYYAQYPEEPGVMDRVTNFITEQFN